MEWIGPLLIGFLVFGAVVQLFWAHTLSTIAEKTDQSEFMQVLAWIPLLQIAPTLAAGGGSVGRFLIGIVALIAGNAALIAMAAFLGDGFGRGVAALGLVLTVLLCLFYFGRIACSTASARNLPGWMGLLLFVPILNFFVYPYFAFHDGWIGPNKVGLVIGSVLILSGMAPTFQVVQTMNQNAGFSPALLLAMSNPQFAKFGEATDFPPQIIAVSADPIVIDAPNIRPELTQSHGEAIRTLYQLKGRFDALESRLHSGSSSASTTRRTATVSRESRFAPAALDPAGRTETPSYSDITTPPVRPYPVQASNECPTGTEIRTRMDERNEEEWCQQLSAYGGLRHGWYARYHRDGRPESMGQYENGLRIGVWTRFYPTGEVRAQAEFRKGLQHGWVLTFNQAGKRTRSARFENGTHVPSE